jgi:hypothetical protein
MMAKSIAYTTTMALAVAASAVAMASFGRAEEPMQVSGTAITTQVESHFICNCSPRPRERVAGSFG